MSFIPSPEYTNLKDWADQLYSLYENDFLPILSSEEEWIEWGSLVACANSFIKEGVPAPSPSPTPDKAAWKPWAEIVVSLMSEPLEKTMKIRGVT